MGGGGGPGWYSGTGRIKDCTSLQIFFNKTELGGKSSFQQARVYYPMEYQTGAFAVRSRPSQRVRETLGLGMGHGRPQIPSVLAFQALALTFNHPGINQSKYLITGLL